MVISCSNSILFLPFDLVGLGVVVAVVFAVVVIVVDTVVVAVVAVIVDAAVEVFVVAVVIVVVAVVGSVVAASHWSKEGASLGPPTALHSASNVRYSRHSSEVEL